MKKRFHLPRRSSRDIERDVESELAFHIDSRIAELTRTGMTADEARATALREFGDVGNAREYINAMDRRTEATVRRRDYLGDLKQDLVYAFRTLRVARAFSLTVIITLALGVGANAAIFSVVNGVLLQPLPFENDEQLYRVWSANRTSGNLQATVSVLDVDDWRAQRREITDIGGYFHSPGGTGMDLTGARDPQRLSVTYFTPGFFSTLAIRPQLGRTPREEEMVRGGPDRVVVLSHRFWQREFGESAGIIDSTLTLNGDPYRVIGVLGADIRFPSEGVDVYVPYSTIPDQSIPRIRPVRILGVVARAAPGMTRERVETELDAIAKNLSVAYPAENGLWDGVTVQGLRESITGSVSRSLWILLGAVGFVLLIACVNIASLQIARGSMRRSELAVRMALGAGRGRIIRQLVTENLVLAAIGGVLGLFVAKLGLVALLTLSAGQLPRGTEIHIDALVIAFSLAVAMVCGLAFGVTPALLSTRNIQQTLRAAGRGAAGSAAGLRSALVVAEVALAVVLVVGGGLMARSFLSLLQQDPGFRPGQTLAMNLSLSPQRHANFRDVYTRMLDAARAVPGVVSAGAIRHAPFRGNGEINGFMLDGLVVPSGQNAPSAAMITVSDGVFRTLGAPMVQGREFEPSDKAGTTPVAVVNEAFVRLWFPDRAAVGQALIMGATRFQIVGVVNDIRQVAMSQPATPTIYLSNVQTGRVQATFVVRTQGEPMLLAESLRRAIWSVDRLQPITSVFTLEEAMGDALARPRLITVVLGFFGVLGMLLGAIGLYGVLAFLISQRRREIGVRLALGATPARVLGMILSKGLALAGTGVVVGVTGAILLGGYLRDVLYGVAPTDVRTFAVVSVMLLVVSAVASIIPARRAASVDPAITLRGE